MPMQALMIDDKRTYHGKRPYHGNYKRRTLHIIFIILERPFLIKKLKIQTMKVLILSLVAIYFDFTYILVNFIERIIMDGWTF